VFTVIVAYLNGRTQVVTNTYVHNHHHHYNNNNNNNNNNMYCVTSQEQAQVISSQSDYKKVSLVEYDKIGQEDGSRCANMSVCLGDIAATVTAQCCTTTHPPTVLIS
jgi:hypothetical protein